MGIDNFLDGVGKALEIAPDLYDDVIKDAAQGTGKTLGLIPRTINAAFVPLRIWIEKREYNLEETKKLLAKRLENVDPEKIVTPEPEVAIPALQAISYSNEKLRDYYANLLSKAMNKDEKDSVHPSFVEVLKQLDPRDASNLALFAVALNPFPVADYRIWSKSTHETGESFNTLVSNVFLSNPLYVLDIEPQSVSIAHLDHLGLIKIDMNNSMSNDSAYDVFYKHPYYIQQIRSIESNKDLSDEEYSLIHPGMKRFTKMSLSTGSVLLTPYGRRFYKVCISEDTSNYSTLIKQNL